jgi:membrane-associated phospholipid phosphatase
MHPRLSFRLAAAGLALVAAGLACWWSGLDLRLHPLLRLAPGTGLATGVAALSSLGRFAVLGPASLIAGAILVAVRRGRDAAWFLLASLSGQLAVEVVKPLVHRARPAAVDRLEIVHGWSFPSAHSADTALTVLLLAALAPPGARPWLAALGWAAAIGWTRLALGVHWPGDVLAGWGLGLVWVAAAIRLRPRAGGRQA